MTRVATVASNTSLTRIPLYLAACAASRAGSGPGAGRVWSGGGRRSVGRGGRHRRGAAARWHRRRRAAPGGLAARAAAAVLAARAGSGGAGGAGSGGGGGAARAALAAAAGVRGQRGGGRRRRGRRRQWAGTAAGTGGGGGSGGSGGGGADCRSAGPAARGADGRAQALMVVGDPAALTLGDVRLQAMIEVRGYQVTVVDDAAPAQHVGRAADRDQLDLRVDHRAGDLPEHPGAGAEPGSLDHGRHEDDRSHQDRPLR